MSTVSSLRELANKYFHTKGYKIESNINLEGASGMSQKFDLLVTKYNEQHLVKILDWKRTVGVNVVINLDKAAEDVEIKKPIMISEKFSSHAKAYANRKGLMLLTRKELNKF